MLLKQVVTVGGISTIRMGDNNVEYDPNFRLYISTKMTNPHYPPELCVKVGTELSSTTFDSGLTFREVLDDDGGSERP